jgi:crotonobetainyl-CoA:carnitine CoA-transferase CaiB-like acyl-CoA transferase
MNIAGPYAGMILADLGADVVKVERPGGGDDARRMVPRYANGSAYFYAINRNKTSREIDLRADTGRAAFTERLRDADVLLTNLRPATLRKLGLDSDNLLRDHPSLIYADISAYGTRGDDADRPGYDMVLQARSGIMSINGDPGSPPARVGVSVLDMGAAQWIALGVLAALHRRTRTGRGGRVSTSLLEAGTAFMAYDLAAYQLTGDIPQRRGAGHPSFGPYGVYATADGQLAIGVGNDGVFARLAAAAGAPEWLADSRYATNAGRMTHATQLRADLEARFAAKTAREWIPVLVAADVPADIVADTPAVLADPQLQALDAWCELTVGDDSRPLRVPALPLRLDDIRPPLRLPAPEHPIHE